MSDVERLREAWEVWSNPGSRYKDARLGTNDAAVAHKKLLKSFPAICDVLEAAGRAEIDLRTNINPALGATGLHPMMLMEKDLSVALARLHDQLEAQS